MKCRGRGISQDYGAARPRGESEQSLICRERAEQSSDDEEHFKHKEQRRLARDRAKLNPLILGTSSTLVACHLMLHCPEVSESSFVSGLPGNILCSVEGT